MISDRLGTYILVTDKRKAVLAWNGPDPLLPRYRNVNFDRGAVFIDKLLYL
jgi:hypothetical protein